MVLWICLGVLIVGLGVVVMLLLDLRAKKARLDGALKKAQTQTGPAIEVVRSLTELPKPALKLAKPHKTLVGAPAPTGEHTES